MLCMQGITKLIAGDSLDFVTSVDAYPADAGWSLSYRLVPRFATPTQAPITLAATTYEVSNYRVQVVPATTAPWVAGLYSWASYVSKAGQRITLEQGGELTVAPDPGAIAQGVDVRSDAERSLAAITAQLGGKATAATESYRINGRELKSYPLPDLIMLRDRLSATVARERNHARLVAGLPDMRKTLVRMARA